MSFNSDFQKIIKISSIDMIKYPFINNLLSYSKTFKNTHHNMFLNAIISINANHLKILFKLAKIFNYEIFSFNFILYKFNPNINLSFISNHYQTHLPLQVHYLFYKYFTY